MKPLQILITLLSLILSVGCCTKKSATPTTAEKQILIDTVIIRDTIYITLERALITDKCLEHELMIMNIRHYIEITERNKTNQKFFFGWIKRAVQEQ